MTITSSSIIKKLLILLLVALGLHLGRYFLMPLAIGGLLATLFLPVCRWLQSKKVPAGLSAFLCVLLLLSFIYGLGMLLGWQIAELTNDITLVRQKFVQTINSIQAYIFEHFGISEEKQSQWIENGQESFSGIIQLVAGSVVTLIGNFILMLVYIFLLLYYRGHLLDFLLRLAAPAQKEEVRQMVVGAARVSQQYLVGLSKMIACLWIMYSIGFGIAGVKNFIFFAILCGLLEVVPFIGNLTGAALTLLVAAVQGAGYSMLGGIAITYGVVQFIQGWVLEPLIVGKQVKINSLFTIIALVLGELLWGIPGIILAIPLTAMFKIVCDHIEHLKPYGFLIGEVERNKRDPGVLKRIKNWFKQERS